MKHQIEKFVSVIERRFRHAGKAIIERGHPFFVPIDAARADKELLGQSLTSFAHYDYLALGHEPEVVNAAINALQTLGTSTSASRLVGGERRANALLEQELAAYFGHEASLTLISGYLTNVTLINHLMGHRDLVIIDELAHNSIHVGAKSGRFGCQLFAHNDFDDLEKTLSANRGQYRNVLIVVEGLYSMDGDVPDLARLLRIKNEHDCWLLVDEAHSLGVLGKTGRGICELQEINPQDIDIVVGTLSKTFVSSGGFICAKHSVIDYLRFTLPGFIYSVGLTPATQASARAALAFLRKNPMRVAEVQRLSSYFASAARKAGLDIGAAIGHGVVPIYFSSADETVRVSQVLMDAGIYAPPVIQVGIPKDQPRIRFFITARHSEAEIDRTIDLIANSLATGNTSAGSASAMMK